MKNILQTIIEPMGQNGKSTSSKKKNNNKTQFHNFLTERNSQNIFENSQKQVYPTAQNRQNISQSQHQNLFKLRSPSLGDAKQTVSQTTNTSYYQDQSTTINLQSTFTSPQFKQSKGYNQSFHNYQPQYSKQKTAGNSFFQTGKTLQTSSNFLNSFSLGETSEIFDKQLLTQYTQQNDTIGTNKAIFPQLIDFVNQPNDASINQKQDKQIYDKRLSIESLHINQNYKTQLSPTQVKKKVSPSLHFTNQTSQDLQPQKCLFAKKSNGVKVGELSFHSFLMGEKNSSQSNNSKSISKLDLALKKTLSPISNSTFSLNAASINKVLQQNKQGFSKQIDSKYYNNTSYQAQTNFSQPSFFMQRNPSKHDRATLLISNQYIDELNMIMIKQAEKLNLEINISPLHRKRKNRNKEGMNPSLEQQRIIQQITDSQNIYNLCDTFISNLKIDSISMNDLYQILNSIEEKASNCSNISVFLTAKYIKCLLASICSDLDISLKNWKEYLRICNSSQLFYYKIIGYKNIADIYRRKGNYDKSLVYLKKLLKYSWLYNNSEYENYTYEQISKTYFYLNNLDLAIFFHERMMEDNLEDDNSRLRKLGVQLTKYDQEQKVKLILDNSLSEDEFDLESFKNAGVTEYQQSQDKKNEKSSINQNNLGKSELNEKKLINYFDQNDEIQQIQLKLKQSILNTRLNKYKVNSKITSLEGMKAIATIKNKMIAPLGPITPKTQYRKHDYVNLHGKIHLSQKKELQFMVSRKNTIKTFDKIYINHLSGSRQIDYLVNLNNRFDEQTIDLISNDCIRLKKVYPIMLKVIEHFKENIKYFTQQCQYKLKCINSQ